MDLAFLVFSVPPSVVISVPLAERLVRRFGFGGSGVQSWALFVATAGPSIISGRYLRRLS